MSQPSVSEDPALWHRKFGAMGNNRAWALSVSSRSDAEDQEMLSAAHASAWHWSQVGTELNRMRAVTLLAEVHALRGFGRSAWAYAEQVQEYFLRVGAEPWETALVHVVHAHAASVAGEIAAHRRSYELAAVAVPAIANEEERSIVASTFSHVPKP
jgi:hypothetical protein